MDIKDAISLSLNHTSACGEKLFFIEVGLRGGNITIIEGDSPFPPIENSGKLGIMFGISHLNFHHLHFVSAPELLLPGPLVPCHPPLSLEKMEEGKKISSFPSRIEPRPERIFVSAKGTPFPLDPENH
jgi:hypothetical protein